MGKVYAMRVSKSKSSTATRWGANLAESGVTLSRRRGARRDPPPAVAVAATATPSGIAVAVTSVPPAPAQEPTMRVFPAWPAEWEATFTLRARGAFVVTAAQKNGRVESVEILSEAGAPLRLHNPWGHAEITVVRDGGKPERLRGTPLRLSTRAGERLQFTP